VKIYLDGIPQGLGLVGRQDDRARHLRRGAAVGVEVTADFEFDVPVRFGTDHMGVTIETYRLHAWQQIPNHGAQGIVTPPAISSDRKKSPSNKRQSVAMFTGGLSGGAPWICGHGI
jgi:hypothetical protein